jgi:hypothetical protein
MLPLMTAPMLNTSDRCNGGKPFSDDQISVDPMAFPAVMYSLFTYYAKFFLQLSCTGALGALRCVCQSNTEQRNADNTTIMHWIGLVIVFNHISRYITEHDYHSLAVAKIVQYHTTNIKSNENGHYHTITFCIT